MTRPTIVADAVAESACWHLLASLFRRPEPRWESEIRALAAEVPDLLVRSVAEAAAGASEGEYLRILGPGGRVAAREAGHSGWRDPGWILADLARYYDAFGYAPSAEDPLDHVAVEADFVAYLHLKEALALEVGDDDAAQVTSAAREAFVADHLATLATGLARRLGLADAAHLAGAADLLAARIPSAVRAVSGPDEDEVDPPADGCGACKE